MTIKKEIISEDIVKGMKERAIDNIKYKKNTLEKVYDNPFDAREASDEEDRKNLQEGRRTDMSRDRDFGYIKGNKYRD